MWQRLCSSACAASSSDSEQHEAGGFSQSAAQSGCPQPTLASLGLFLCCSSTRAGRAGVQAYAGAASSIIAAQVSLCHFWLAICFSWSTTRQPVRHQGRPALPCQHSFKPQLFAAIWLAGGVGVSGSTQAGRQQWQRYNSYCCQIKSSKAEMGLKARTCMLTLYQPSALSAQGQLQCKPDMRGRSVQAAS